MEWEKMLEEYFAMLESFSGMALFEEAVRMEEEMAGWEAERMREVGDEKERMRLGSGEGDGRILGGGIWRGDGLDGRGWGFGEWGCGNGRGGEADGKSGGDGGGRFPRVWRGWAGSK